MEKIIVTIGREFGSGGHEVGKKLAEKLGIAFYDAELIEKAAESTGLKKEYVLRNEEKGPSISVSSIFSGIDAFQKSPYEEIEEAEFEIIREITAKESCVIVGRAADCIIQDEVHVSIFTFAPIEDRIERVRAKRTTYSMLEDEDFDESRIEKVIKNVDKQRRKYYEFYTEKKWGSRDAYDLLINTSRTGIDGAVSIIETYIRESRGKNLLSD